MNAGSTALWAARRPVTNGPPAILARNQCHLHWPRPRAVILPQPERARKRFIDLQTGPRGPFICLVMPPVIPFRRRSSLPSMLIALGAIAVAAIGFAATRSFMDRQGGPGTQIRAENSHADTIQLGPIEVIDGDTVRFQGAVYRLSGFDAPEVGDKARCDDERRRADAATSRLRVLIRGGNARLIRVACSCRPGQEGSRFCNYGRLCGSLLIGGQDVGGILISEGLAHPYVCGATSCPPRRPWCGVIR
jgi:endonuclease YncB( thermonuclease family)